MEILAITDGRNEQCAQVDKEGVLLVGLEGFTIEDLARTYPGLGVALHVKDGDEWVPIKIEDLI